MNSTIVFVHAHPDDEASGTGGTIARAAAEGHRVVLVVCTNGEHGERPDDLAPCETLVDRRRRETARSAEILGIERVVWLGYSDSGMHGWEQNAAAGSFWSADIDEAGARLADLLRDERADIVVVYDWHGGYGHPDHIQVHRVGHRAADLAGTPQRFESTFNRDAGRRLSESLRELGAPDGEEWDIDGPADDGNPFGTPEAELHLAVDVSDYIDAKRAALAAHASQTTDVTAMLNIPRDAFDTLFGTEWFIEPGAPPGLRTGFLVR
ncbi:MAG: PIG-L family deacetylase [Actinomycetota bacterium]|nr:PIG-L family deacetylase [Acidimicrobiia bacterium]MDQ3468448.1 PIG-L family deacetylase [Actinomycetota bacterium]